MTRPNLTGFSSGDRPSHPPPPPNGLAGRTVSITAAKKTIGACAIDVQAISGKTGRIVANASISLVDRHYEPGRRRYDQEGLACLLAALERVGATGRWTNQAPASDAVAAINGSKISALKINVGSAQRGPAISG